MLNGQKVIGIVPAAPLFEETDNRYDDKYSFSDTYCVRVTEAGMLPIGVLPVGGRIRNRILDLCDAFIIQGGKMVRPYHIDIIDYAISKEKKMLCICLGCQTLQCYFVTKNEAERRQWHGNLADLYSVLLFKENYPFLSPVDGHNLSPILPRKNTAGTKHRVCFSEGSHTAEVFGCTELMGASFHSFCIADPAPELIVSGRADDGIIEAVEYGDLIIGTQFHPDADGELPQVFKWLAE